MTQNDLDEKSIDQLHDAVVEFSKNCFELKKLCATVVGTTLTLLAAFTEQLSVPTFFAAIGLVTTFFWMADAQSYFYQEKIRIQMKAFQNSISSRLSTPLIVDGVGMPISDVRVERSRYKRVVLSIFNWSMMFYIGLLMIDAGIFACYILDLF